MTFYRDLCDDGFHSQYGYEDFHGFGGLNGFRFGSPYGYHRDQYRHESPYGYYREQYRHESPYGYYREQYRHESPYSFRSFGNLYKNRGLFSHGGYYGNGDLYGFGYSHPFSSHFGNRYN